MRVFKSMFAVPVCAVFLWLVPAVAQADPIRVTGGTGTIFPGETTLVTMTGDGLSLTAQGAGIHDGGPAVVGTLANLDGSFDLFPVDGALPATVNGVTYQAVLGGSLAFTTDPFLVEAPAGGAGTQVTFRVPFSMTGSVQGFAPAGVSGREFGAQLFSIQVFGTGTATQTKTFNGTGFLPPQAPIIYTFEAAASPTPEPASMLLLGTGLGGLVLRQRRRSGK